MYSRSFRLFRSNINLSITYLIISIITIVVSNNLEGFPLFIILLLYALLALNFMITGSEIIKEDNKISIKNCFLRFDKEIIRSVFILIVFLSAILLIFKGPMLIISITPLSAKLDQLLSESQLFAIFFLAVVILFSSFYKMFFLTSVANIVYHKSDTMNSLKAGLKTTFKLKSLLLIVVAIGTAAAFLPYFDETGLAFKYFESVTDIILKPLIFLMAFYYFHEIESASLAHEESPNKPLERDA